MEPSSQVLYRGGQGEIVEKKSRFIANIFPVRSEEEALAKITEMKKKYYDARHNCFAYILGEPNPTMRSSDDGEPSGTAGRPMLDVLEGQGICDVVAVVTRYFGGTLLGTGGLVRAYSAAMKEGLEHCVVLERKVGICLRLVMDYNEVGKIQYLARNRQIPELQCEYADEVTMELLVPETEIDATETEITEKTSGKVKLCRDKIVPYGMAAGELILL